MIVSANTKTAFKVTNFQNEKELQNTIENLPNLLNVISQLNGQDYPLFIIKREFGVSSGSMDFLAVDVEGAIYVIETKLAENPELRRAVIGQVLEYASNLSDMSYDEVATKCLKYLQKSGSLEQVIHDFYVAQSDGEPTSSSDEYKKAITENLNSRRFNIVIIANKVSLEIQNLFHFVDEETKDNLNFIVLEINKYHLNSEEIFHSGIVWAAKYTKALVIKGGIDEGAYIASKSPHVQMLIKHIDSLCQAKGLSKTANTKGLSWKHTSGGSIVITGDTTLVTNWTTLPVKSKEMDSFKENVMKMASKAGFVVVQNKHGTIRLELNDNSRVEEDVDKFIELAYSVLHKANELAKQSSQ